MDLVSREIGRTRRDLHSAATTHGALVPQNPLDSSSILLTNLRSKNRPFIDNRRLVEMEPSNKARVNRTPYFGSS